MAQKSQLTTIQKVNPLNKEAEKKKFFFDPLYNPQFVYAEEINQEEYFKYGMISNNYVDQAQATVDAIIKKYGTETAYLEEVEGRVLTKEETEAMLAEYLKKMGLTDALQIQYSTEYVARTSLQKNILKIRLPIDYREHSFVSTLNHELGTHFLRNLNDQKQPWHNNRSSFKLGDYLETEEGLALLNQYIGANDHHFWLSALSYLATWYGQFHSFVELDKYLQKYIDDKDRRWKMCVRVKRGLKDTSLPGAFSRNQVYYAGAVKVAKYLIETDFEMRPLYLGKVGLEDAVKLASVTDIEIRLPSFFTDDQKWYQDQIKKIITANKLLQQA